MGKAASSPSAKAASATQGVAAPLAKDNPGRELLELRLRWKIINETVEAGIAERRRLRAAIDSLAKELQQNKGET
jgi:hypothetical protein